MEVGASPESNNVSIEDLKDFEVDVKSPKDGRLVHILKNYCLKSTSLDYFHKMCVKAQLDWDWIGKRIILLANQGGIIFPNPWTIKYIMTDLQPGKEEKPRVLKRRKIVGTRLWQLFGRSSEPVSEGYVYSQMKDRGYEQEEVEPVLNDLINEGYIIRPRPGFLRFIEDWRD